MEVIVETHYSIEDTDCTGDYYSIVIRDKKTKKELVTFGDYYHDKGSEKAEGFLMGLEMGLDKKLEIEEVDIADIEY